MTMISEQNTAAPQDDPEYLNPYTPVFLKDPVIDAMMHVTLELGAELWALRSRVRVLEALVGEQAGVDGSPVDAKFEEDPTIIDSDDERNAFVRRVFGEYARLQTD